MAFIRSSTITVFAVTSLAFTVAANASLIDRGAGLIYDTDRDITWLANANYGAGSSYDDGFSTTDGLMTWQSAVDWASNLTYFDAVRGVTYSDWRLPTTVQPDATCGTQQGGGAFSAGPNCTGSELGHMFYVELGGVAYSSIVGSSDPDLALFANLLGDGYWSNTPYALDPAFAWVLNFGYGLQAADNRNLGYYAWAVRDGDVFAVPEPTAACLIGAALLALGTRARRSSAPHND